MWQLAGEETIHIEPEPAFRVTVGFGMQKGDRPELTVQKLTELGVDVIVPLLTERTVVRLDARSASLRLERLERVAREAAAQSRRVRLPEVLAPLDLKAACTRFPEAHFAEIDGAVFSEDVRCVFVGPEGGWTEQELALHRRHVDLNDAVLRAETAAIAAGVLLCSYRARV